MEVGVQQCRAAGSVENLQQVVGFLENIARKHRRRKLYIPHSEEEKVDIY
jgi:hypothetical protein